MAAQTYPLPLPSIRLWISGVDRTDEVVSKTLHINQILGSQVDRCRFALKPKESYRGSAGAKPLNGATILVEQQNGSTAAWTAVFGGIITRVRDVRLAYKTRRWDIEAVDYSSLAAKLLVNETFANLKVSDIAAAVTRSSIPYVSTSGIDATNTTVRVITFAREYPGEALDRLAKIAGYEWYITPNRVLEFFSPTSAPLSSLEITDDSNNFNELVIEPQLDQIRNRVFVEGGSALSDEVEEIWDFDGIKDVFSLAHQNIVPDLKPLTSGLSTSRFMEIDGIPQVVGLAGIVDDAPGIDFICDRTQGEVRTSAHRRRPADGERGIFRYKYLIPVSVVKEDRVSQKLIAEAEGRDYPNVMTSGAPVHWWRMDDTSGQTVTNDRAVSASGMIIGTSLDYSTCGPLSGDQGTAMRFFGSRVQCYSGAVLPRTAYTLEAWVNAPYQGVDQGIVGQWNDRLNSGGTNGIGAVLLISGLTYSMRHLNLQATSNRRPSGGGKFDHVAVTWNGSTFRMFVNKEVSEIGVSVGTLELPAVSGVEIGNYNYLYGNDHKLRGSIAEVAVYDRALTPTEIAEHHDAGRFGGVREAVVVDNTLASFEQADEYARRQLRLWANPLTDIRFQSFVTGWQVGEQVKVQVSGVGITFSGAALIQDLSIRSIGTQRFLYDVHCTGARFNLIDYYRDLSRTKDLVTDQAAIINLSRPFTDRPTFVILVGGDADTVHVGAPFYVKPQWGTGTEPYGEIGFSTMPRAAW